MQYPTLSPVSQSYEFIERFGGYRHTENLDAGEFFNMEIREISTYMIQKETHL